MQKMMTYSEANEVLGASLTPLNRCLSKAVAIANDADPDLLVNYTNDRLVPANAIEPGTHVEVSHFFCDKDGNYLGTDYTIDVPEGQGSFVIYTKILIDGLIPDESMYDLVSWDDRGGEVYYAKYRAVYPYVGGPDLFSYVNDQANSNGVIRTVYYADATGKISSDEYLLYINWSDAARTMGIKSTYPIKLTVNPVKHNDYSISKTVIGFGLKSSGNNNTKDSGTAEQITISGFTNPKVKKISKVERILSNSTTVSINTAQWFTLAQIVGNKLLVVKTNNPGSYATSMGGSGASTYRYRDIYNIYDSNKSLYLVVSNSTGQSKPGQSESVIYEPDTKSYEYTTDHPETAFDSKFFYLGLGPLIKDIFDISQVAVFVRFFKNPANCRFVSVRNTASGSETSVSKWFLSGEYTLETMFSNFDNDDIGNNILWDSQLYEFINSAIISQSHLYIEAYHEDGGFPSTLYLTTSKSLLP